MSCICGYCAIRSVAPRKRRVNRNTGRRKPPDDEISRVPRRSYEEKLIRRSTDSFSVSEEDMKKENSAFWATRLRLVKSA